MSATASGCTTDVEEVADTEQSGVLRLRGVKAVGSRFRASLTHAGKKRTLGEFDSAQEAARAHDREALRHLGHDAAAARLNFPVEDQPAEAELTSRKRPREPDNANVAPALPPPGHRLALPDGWLECPRMGGLFCQHLVPCKVPLGRRFNEVLCGALEAKRFTPADAVRLAQTAPEGSVQKRRVVAVINLTKTSRYYSPEEEGLGGDIRYFNLRCDGAGGAPSAEEVNAFVCLVESVLGDARLAQTPFCPVILVHCTHGYNRTGAMLVHHAMRTQGARPDLVAALGAFARCRPPCGIYKEDYIASLFSYYHDVRPQPPHAACPPTPPWKREPGGPPPLRDEDIPPGDMWGLDNESYVAARAVSDVAMPDEVGEAAPCAPAPKHDDVLGEAVPDELAASIRTLCRELTSHTVAAARAAQQAVEGVDFPGSQPVSLSRANAPLLCDPALDYMVSWKADGTRYLLLLLHGGAYLLDRAGRVRRVQMRFPTPDCEAGKPYRPLRAHDYTLLDGEMVVDASGTAGLPPQRRFLAYDLCSMGLTGREGVRQLCDRPFRERYELIERLVVAPKKAFEHAARGRYNAAAEPFHIRRKQFFEPARAAWLLHEFMPTLTHPSDGLIFQPGREGYRGRTNEHLLKWKFPELNTVDFLVRPEEGGAPVLCVTGDGGRLKALAEVVLPPELRDEEGGASPLEAGLYLEDAEEGEPGLEYGQVAECRWDGRRVAWSLLRVRRDKEHPNHETVFLKVWQSIRDDMRAGDVLQVLAGTSGA